MPKLLLIDDDEKLVDMLVDWLSDEGYIVEVAVNGIEALNLMKSFGFDVIILDWDLPGHAGPDVCKSYRDWGGDVPIIMLTGKSAIEEKEKGYLSGIDDYLTKPFNPKELSMRVRALLNRAVRGDKMSVVFGDLALDVQKKRISVRGIEIKLSVREFSLLEFFMRHPEQVFDADALLDRVWQSDVAVGKKAVRICIARVREKLTPDAGVDIVTVPGFGYRLSLKPAGSSVSE
jgi:DNA-binding response OmpR family regulator